MFGQPKSDVGKEIFTQSDVVVVQGGTGEGEEEDDVPSLIESVSIGQSRDEEAQGDGDSSSSVAPPTSTTSGEVDKVAEEEAPVDSGNVLLEVD